MTSRQNTKKDWYIFYIVNGRKHYLFKFYHGGRKAIYSPFRVIARKWRSADEAAAYLHSFDYPFTLGKPNYLYAKGKRRMIMLCRLQK